MVLEINERINDDTNWMRLNYALLMKTRSEVPAVRCCILTLLEHLFEVLSERYLVTLSDTIPFLTELLEDEDEQVENIAKRIVNTVEKLSGESI